MRPVPNRTGLLLSREWVSMTHNQGNDLQKILKDFKISKSCVTDAVS